MSKSNIIFTAIICVIIIAVGTFLAVNWNGIKEIISGNQIYTSDDVDNAYEQGQADSADLLIKYNNILLELQNKNIELANAQANLEQAIAEQESMQSANTELNNQITTLQNTITRLNEQIDVLTEQLNELAGSTTSDIDGMYVVDNALSQTLGLSSGESSLFNSYSTCSTHNSNMVFHPTLTALEFLNKELTYNNLLISNITGYDDNAITKAKNALTTACDFSDGTPFGIATSTFGGTITCNLDGSDTQTLMNGTGYWIVLATNDYIYIAYNYYFVVTEHWLNVDDIDNRKISHAGYGSWAKVFTKEVSV